MSGTIGAYMPSTCHVCLVHAMFVCQHTQESHANDIKVGLNMKELYRVCVCACMLCHLLAQIRQQPVTYRAKASKHTWRPSQRRIQAEEDAGRLHGIDNVIYV